ncbi:hypothetical protein [Alterisphingorhabdus coralli]|uniref:Uncharacterized protein n=1 Tax=Alterisphingorhabdus coralli TaxID=3071408 RepID=A0AA97I2L5_9SPHN|nr:hypothetical protein [Parasphingorhabdus sp. SCSIO 66989]WOE76530.1 hypothetical protein RB602_07390 [Parasphingorhabdus sp. SCSIO 66989]
MRRYKQEQIESYERGRLEWLNRSEKLRDIVLSRSFNSDRAEQFSREGFARRLGYLEHAMHRLDELYPPNSIGASRDTVRDVELLIQAFVMNVFGALDNLAWIWALENNVKRPDGKDLRRTEVVFDGPKAKTLVKSLTPALCNVIADMKDWFAALRIYRDGVAHQIPIYIPFLFNESEDIESKRLNDAIRDAIADGDHGLVVELYSKRNELGDYGALMALSVEHSTMMLHPQMVCDLATVVNLGEQMFTELERL